MLFKLKIWAKQKKKSTKALTIFKNPKNNSHAREVNILSQWV